MEDTFLEEAEKLCRDGQPLPVDLIARLLDIGIDVSALEQTLRT